MSSGNKMSCVLALICLMAISTASSEITGEDVEMVPKEKNTLQCATTTPSISDKKATWYRDGKEISADNDKYEIWGNNNSIVIISAEPKDCGAYVCVFKDDSGKIFNHTVYLLASAHVKHFDRSKNLVQGDNLLLECHAYGYPLPAVTWFKGDQEVTQGGRVTLQENEGLENATLKIKDLTFDDRADYTCVASNYLGSHNSTIIVRVKDKLAALWPFLGICAEVIILCLIIFIYERHRAKKLEEEEMQESAAHDMTNSNDHKGKDDVRQRK